MSTSCKTNISEPEQLLLIPGDATVVFEVSGNDIFAKSGLDSPDNYNLFNFVRIMNADASTFLENFFKGSKEAGISAKKILFYVSQLPDYAVSMPILDKEVFEDFIKKEEIGEPWDEGEFSYVVIGNSFSMAWNDELAMISNALSREKIAEQFKSKNDGLFAKSSDFQEFAKKSADMRLWMRYNFLIDSYKNLMRLNKDFDAELLDKFSSQFEDFANVSMHSYLNFEDGKITGNALFYPPEEVENLRKKYPIYKESFNADILKDMPEQSYLAVNAFFDVKEYVKIARQNIENMLSNSKINDSRVEEKSAELFNFLDSPQFKSVVDALKGDILVNIHGFSTGIITYPFVSVSFTVDGESGFKNILDLIPRDYYKKQDNYYSIAVNKTFIPVYFAYNDSKVFVSNDLEATKVFTEGRKEKTFADNPIGKIMTDKSVFYINLDFETYPDNVKMLLQNFMGEKYKFFTSFVEIYEYLYVAGDTKYNIEFSLQLKNKNVNALKQILTNIDKTISSAWMN
ncbi:MAG: DUF4836 family protein [Prevotellaceae bacterium]|jgi:hypothetical protein|nr:DUF4836 family protein [Prevotellaceae bacterium]